LRSPQNEGSTLKIPTILSQGFYGAGGHHRK